MRKGSGGRPALADRMTRRQGKALTSVASLSLVTGAIALVIFDGDAASPRSPAAPTTQPTTIILEIEPVLPDPAAALQSVLRQHPNLAPDAEPAFRREPIVIVPVDDLFVLVVAEEADDQSLPSITGSVGVFYLRSAPAGDEVVGAWPSLTMGAPMGRAPDIQVSSDFGQHPVLVVTARHVRAGVACELTQLIELLPSSPLASEPFVSGFDDRGAKGPAGRSWTGRILSMTEDREFTLQGGEELVTFRKIDGRYTADPRVQEPSC